MDHTVPLSYTLSVFVEGNTSEIKSNTDSMGQSFAKKCDLEADTVNETICNTEEDSHEPESMSCKEKMKLIVSLWIRKMSFDSFPVEIFTLIVNGFAYHRQMDQNYSSIEFNENNKALLKVLVIGSERVGKTALFKRYIDDIFIEVYRPTIGADFMIKNIPFGSDPKRQLELQIWDTAGQESFQSFGVAFYRGSDIVLLCYDITNRKSLMEIKEKWNPELNDIVDEKGILKILVGTKCDLKKEKMCSKNTIMRFGKWQQSERDIGSTV